jgi:hypothetical protein
MLYSAQLYCLPVPTCTACLYPPVPQECGKEGQICCYSSDPTTEAERCAQGLTCIVSRVGYADHNMYYKLLKEPEGLKSTETMGICK